MHGAVEHHGGGHAFQPEGADEGGGLPVSVRNRGAASGPPWRTAIAPGHLGRGAGLIDEDQPLGIEIGLRLEPGLSSTRDVRALLLAGVRGFF